MVGAPAVEPPGQPIGLRVGGLARAAGRRVVAGHRVDPLSGTRPCDGRRPARTPVAVGPVRSRPRAAAATRVYWSSVESYAGSARAHLARRSDRARRRAPCSVSPFSSGSSSLRTVPSAEPRDGARRADHREGGAGADHEVGAQRPHRDPELLVPARIGFGGQLAAGSVRSLAVRAHPAQAVEGVERLGLPVERASRTPRGAAWCPCGASRAGRRCGSSRRSRPRRRTSSTTGSPPARLARPARSATGRARGPPPRPRRRPPPPPSPAAAAATARRPRAGAGRARAAAARRGRAR